MMQQHAPIIMASAGDEAEDSFGPFARRGVVGLAVALVILLIAGSGVALMHRYFDTLNDARQDTTNLATVLEEHAQRTLRVIEVTLLGVRETLEKGGFLDAMDAGRIGEILADRKRDTPEALNLFLVGEDGWSVVDATGNRVPLDLRDRGYVKYHRGSAGSWLNISEPLLSASGRGRVIIVSLRVSNPDGSLRAIVGASVSTDYFQDFYRSIDAGRQGVVALRTRAGATAVRQPPAATSSQEGDTSSVISNAVTLGRTSGTESYVGQADGVRRITAFCVVTGTPFVVTVGFANSDVLAPWWRDLFRYAAATLLVALASIGAAWFLLRQIAAREAADRLRRASERDATDSVRKSQASEHKARTRLEMLLQRMPLGCLVADAELRMTYWNPAAEAIFGCRFEEMKGLTPFETGLILEERSVVEAQHDRLRRGEMTGFTVARNLTKDGRTILCEWTNTPLVDQAGKFSGVLSLVQDITERRKVEDALRQSSKMDAIGQLTGGVAHDFNNLLTVIMANVELVKFELADRPVEASALQSALDAAVRGSELTHQLLAFSRRQVLEPKIVDVNVLVRGMTRMLSRVIGENVEMRLEAGSDIWPVRIDPVQLETSLANLVVNARDAMRKGGKVVIETANAPLDQEYAARHPDVNPGDYVMVSVSDTGTGMSREVLDRVFEPFFTTKEVGEGTGLGMSMVFGFVKQSGGHIKVYSEVGFGTTVRLYLPRTVAADEDLAESPVGEPRAVESGSETILIVEDDEAVRTVTSEALRRFGYTVLLAGDGRSGLDILDQAGHIDLLFTDMIMPGGITGSELALRARERRPELKVLFTSGYTAPALVDQMLAVSGAHIVSKPYRVADLAREIRGILGQKIDS